MKHKEYIVNYLVNFASSLCLISVAFPFLLLKLPNATSHLSLQRKSENIHPFPLVLRLILQCQHVVYLPRLVQLFQQERRLALRVFSMFSKCNWRNLVQWEENCVTTMVTIPTVFGRAARTVQSHRNCSLLPQRQLVYLVAKMLLENPKIPAVFFLFFT